MISTLPWKTSAERVVDLFCLVALAGAALTGCSSSQSQTPEEPTTEQVAVSSEAQPAGSEPKKKLGYRRVLPTIAFEMLRDSPELYILDLRTAHEFVGSTGRLSRAINIPLAELEQRLAELEPLRSRTFLVYCRQGPCGSRGMVLLRSSGFRDAMLIEGGIESWIAYGFGVVRDGMMVPGRRPNGSPSPGA